MNFELLWNTGPECYVPHYPHFTKHNPEVKQHIAIGAKTSTHREGWRNPDRTIRNWWKNTGTNIVKTKKLIVFEYDVFCNININSVLTPPESGVTGRDIWEVKTSGFPFFSEINRLPESMRKDACALAPLAVTLWDREALDAIADPRWDFLFGQDIFSEMRIATLVRHLGFPVEHASGLHNANYMRRKIDSSPGIYHAIKHKININER